tara:strand:+ start:110 stop:613 length:504 start_codon:yes stop_codon:yes gene_type:complete
MLGSLFADTIVIKKETKDKDGAVKTYNSETMGEYVGILDAKAYLRTPDGNLKEFNCSDVIVIFDNERKPIEYDCSTNTFIPKALTEVDIKKIQKYPVVGGTLIAIGGALVFTTLGKECDDCEPTDGSLSDLLESIEKTKEFTDEILNTQKIGFGLIALGGILVALGI